MEVIRDDRNLIDRQSLIAINKEILLMTLPGDTLSPTDKVSPNYSSIPQPQPETYNCFPDRFKVI